MRSGPESKEISTPVTLQEDQSVFIALWQMVLRIRSPTLTPLDQVWSFL